MLKKIALGVMATLAMTQTALAATQPAQRDTIDTILASAAIPAEQHKMFAVQYLALLRSGSRTDPLDYQLLRLHMAHGKLTPKDIGTTEQELAKLRPAPNQTSRLY